MPAMTPNCGVQPTLGRSKLRSGFFLRLGVHMKRVTGIGGIFFKAKDPVALAPGTKSTLVSTFKIGAGQHFVGPTPRATRLWARRSGTSPTLVATNVLDKTEESEYGKFGWVIDPEGNKVELWEPPADQ